MSEASHERTSILPPWPASPALERFMKSTNIGFYEWHDGVGYDLEALKEMTPNELRYVEALMIRDKDHDWREVDALAALRTPAAIQALRECLRSPNLDCRLIAVRHLKVMEIEDQVEAVVLATLEETRIGVGLSYALALIKDYPTERLKHKLVWCTLYGHEELRVLCAMLALYLYGKTTSPYDNSHRFIFGLKEPDFDKRFEAFNELCRWLELDPNDYPSSAGE